MMNKLQPGKKYCLSTISLRFFAFFSLASCAQPPATLTRSPSGPCWSVTLHDGFSSGDELIDTFSCLNNSSNFDVFLPSIEQLHTTDRDQSLVKDNLAELANRALFSDQQHLIPLLQKIIDLHPTITENISSIVRSTLYGQDTVESPFDLGITDKGILYPLISILPPLSTRILDYPAEKETLESVLFSQEAQEGLCTVFGLIQQPNTRFTLSSMPQSLGKAIAATYETSNDQWQKAQENSAIGLLESLVLEQEDAPPPLVQLAPYLENILLDTRIRTPLKAILLEDLRPELFPSLSYLIDVDRFGNTRSNNSPSALYDIFSIMEQSNAPLECSLSIFSFSITEISIDNLAVDLLSRIANESPETVDTALSLLNVLDLGITDWMLDQIVESEACPMLTPDFVSRFQALQRLNDPQVAPLLSIGLDIIKVFRHPTQSLLPDLANLMSTVHKTTLTEPMEELLIDILDSDLLTEIVLLIPELQNIQAQCPTDIEPLSYTSFLDHAASLVSENNRETLTSFAKSVISQEQFWQIYERIPNVMQQNGMETLIPTFHDLDLYTVDLAIPTPQTRTLIYNTLEHTPLFDEILQYEAQEHTPLTWVGQLFIDETPHQLLSLITWLDERLSILQAEE